MATTTDASLRFTFTHRTSPSSEGDRRQQFWRPFLDVVRASDRTFGETLSVDVLESRIRAQFPRTLKNAIHEIAAPPTRVLSSEKATLAQQLVVRVSEITYNSMTLTAFIEPLDTLVALFDSKFEYFEAFLHTYVPIAFRDALHPEFGSYYGSWADVVYGASLSITVGPGLAQAFTSHAPGNSQPEPTKSVPDRRAYAQWLWIAANTSLVVPVIVTSIFLYLAWKSLDRRMEAIDRAYSELSRARISAAPSPAGSSERPSTDLTKTKK